MSDPFEVLREPIVPAEPDPGFAARLRARLERVVLDPASDWRGADMSTDTRLRQGDVGHTSLLTPDAGRAAAFYGAVLGWRVTAAGSPQELRVEDVVPGLRIRGGHEHPTVSLAYAVDDVAHIADRVRQAGGRATEPERRPYGLVSECADPQGVPFAVYQDTGEGRPARHSSRRGEMSYLTVEVPDSAAAKLFYGSVLGWEFYPGDSEDGWGALISGMEIRPMIGVWGGRERAAVVPMYTVDDIQAAVAGVRENGGTSTDPARQSYGAMAECVDDQGSRFYLGQLDR